jgi:uncharacterized protein
MNLCFEKDDESDISSTACEKQAMQVVMNHDGMTFLPIDGNQRHGLLIINHAYTDDDWLRSKGMSSQADLGVSTIEIFERLGQWRVMPRSHYDRSINVPQPDEIASELRGRSTVAALPAHAFRNPAPLPRGFFIFQPA